jgi:hypothetical protein
LQLFFLAVSQNSSGLNAAINNSLRILVFGKFPHPEAAIQASYRHRFSGTTGSHLSE